MIVNANAARSASDGRELLFCGCCVFFFSFRSVRGSLALASSFIIFLHPTVVLCCARVCVCKVSEKRASQQTLVEGRRTM